jgi:hypothetical protein
MWSLFTGFLRKVLDFFASQEGLVSLKELFLLFDCAWACVDGLWVFLKPLRRLIPSKKAPLLNVVGAFCGDVFMSLLNSRPVVASYIRPLSSILVFTFIFPLSKICSNHNSNLVCMIFASI